MKRIILLLSTLLCTLILHAQEDFDYRPFIEEEKIWVSKPELDFGQFGIITPRVVVEFDYFSGDTLVGDRLCKKWIQDFRDLDGNRLLSFSLPLYEEEKKVWFFLEDQPSPFLAYDFGAKVGDTLAIMGPQAEAYRQLKDTDRLDYFFELFSDTIVLTGKVEEELLGTRRTLFYYRSTDQRKNRDEEMNYYMYGIGTHWTPSHNKSGMSGMGSDWLMYCMVGDKVLYADEEKAKFWGIPSPVSIASMLHDVRPLGHSQCFDLSGRRLATPPAKGMYIENGRKRVVK